MLILRWVFGAIAAVVTFSIGLALVPDSNAQDAELEIERQFNDTSARRAELQIDEDFVESASKALKDYKPEYESVDFPSSGEFQLTLGARDFPAIGWLSLKTSEHNVGANILLPVIPMGNLDANAENLVMVSLISSPQILAFRTAKSRMGTHYEFTGQFTRRVSTEEYGTIVISGTLTKVVNGNKVKESVVAFEEIHSWRSRDLVSMSDLDLKNLKNLGTRNLELELMWLPTVAAR